MVDEQSRKNVNQGVSMGNNDQLPEGDAGKIIVGRPLSPTRRDCEWLAALFDDYRVHHGESASTAEASRWLEENLVHGSLEAFVATDDGVLTGFALVAVIPASLRLGRFWQIRDLFVSPSYRHRGIGGKILNVISGAAATSGALRVSLQTESDNETALRLYARHGYSMLEGYQSLFVDLPVAH